MERRQRSYNAITAESAPHSPDGAQQPQKLATLPEFQIGLTSNQQLALNLLDSDIMLNLSLEQKRQFLIFFSWQDESNLVDKNSDLNLTPQERMQIIDNIVENFEERYERFLGILTLTKTLPKQHISPRVSEFDYWVWENWRDNADRPKVLAQRVPEEFGLADQPKKKLTSKIHVAAHKLRKYGVMDSDFNQRRVGLRRERISQIYKSNGKLPTQKQLATMFNVSRTVIIDDVTDLQSRNQLPILKRPMSQEDEERMGSMIQKAIGLLEEDGRKFSAGDISMAEIASVLEIDQSTIYSFFRYHGRVVGLPERPNRKKMKNELGRQRRQRVEQIIRDNLELSVKDVYKLIQEIEPTIPHSIGYVSILRRKVLKGAQQVTS